MAPASTRSRTQYRKHPVKPKRTRKAVKTESSSVSTVPGSLKLHQIGEDEVEEETSSGCSTPKAPQFRIPELISCPPAPKKRRVVLPYTHQKSPRGPFFNPPDLELFFFFALHDISV